MFIGRRWADKHAREVGGEGVESIVHMYEIVKERSLPKMITEFVSTTKL